MDDDDSGGLADYEYVFNRDLLNAYGELDACVGADDAAGLDAEAVFVLSQDPRGGQADFPIPQTGIFDLTI